MVAQYDNLWELYDKLAENLKVRSNAKTRTEKIQEKVSLKMELARIYNRIQVLSRVIDAFDTNISLSEYVVQNLSTYSTEYLEKINQGLSIVLENQYKKLDTLSKKEVLLQEFSTERRKGNGKYELGLAAVVGGVGSVCCVGIPFVNIMDLPFSLTNLLLPIVVSACVGAVGASNLQKKMVNEKIEAFINLNSELGIDALPLEKDNNTKDEEREIEKSIDAQVHRLMVILMNQKEVQRLIEVSNEQNTQEKNIEQSLNYTDEYRRTSDFETIICNSGRWAGYEDIPSNYPSKILVEGSCRTERDDTMEMGVLYRHLEDDEDEISQEQSGPVKKLIPPKRY